MKKETPHQNPNILINNKTFLLKIQGGETKKKMETRMKQKTLIR